MGRTKPNVQQSAGKVEGDAQVVGVVHAAIIPARGAKDTGLSGVNGQGDDWFWMLEDGIK